MLLEIVGSVWKCIVCSKSASKPSVYVGPKMRLTLGQKCMQGKDCRVSRDPSLLQLGSCQLEFVMKHLKPTARGEVVLVSAFTERELSS